MWRDKNINNSLKTFSWTQSLDWMKNKTKNILYHWAELLEEKYGINMQVEGNVILLATRAA